MGAVLKSVLKNQTLRLACKGTTLVFLIFSYEYSRGFLYLFLFGLALAIFYFRPTINSGKFLVPIIAGLFLMLVLPWGLDTDIYIWFSAVLGTLFALVIGLKNLVFIQKEKVYTLVILTLSALFNIFFFFSESYHIASIILFIANFLILKDLLKNAFSASLFSLIIVELAWALFVLPLDGAWRSVIAILSILAIHKLFISPNSKRF